MNMEIVRKIEKLLQSRDITHEVYGDEHTFAIAPTCTIYTPKCTIDVHKDKIKVNDSPVDNLDDMLYEVLAVEA